MLSHVRRLLALPELIARTTTWLQLISSVSVKRLFRLSTGSGADRPSRVARGSLTSCRWARRYRGELVRQLREPAVG